MKNDQQIKTHSPSDERLPPPIEHRGTNSRSESTHLIDPTLNASKERLPSTTDLKSLRSRCYVLALRFAKGFGFQELIKPAHTGYGFFIDIPLEVINNEALWWAWWFLSSLSEQTVTEDRLRLAPNDMRLPPMILADRMNDLFDRVGTPPEVSLIGHSFLLSPTLSKRSFHDLMLLIESCRVLRTNFKEYELWTGQEKMAGAEDRTDG